MLCSPTRTVLLAFVEVKLGEGSLRFVALPGLGDVDYGARDSFGHVAFLTQLRLNSTLFVSVSSSEHWQQESFWKTLDHLSLDRLKLGVESR